MTVCIVLCEYFVFQRYTSLIAVMFVRLVEMDQLDLHLFISRALHCEQFRIKK